MKYFYKLIFLAAIFFALIQNNSFGQIFNKINENGEIPGFSVSPYYSEQVVTFKYDPEIRIHINAPAPGKFDPSKRVGLVFFALPNGNTIEQTVGKILEAGDDWHYDIQHIGAQTRFLRQHITDYNVVTVYLETSQKSWPSWNANHPDHAAILKNLVEYLKLVFSKYDPFVALTSHSGGGRFTFSFIDAFNQIPDYVERIAFLDSDYGYENTYGSKFVNWLNSSPNHYLSVIAYNDSVALYNGEPIVSPTGGTWYRTRMMKKYLQSYYSFTDEEDSSFYTHTALSGRIKIILKKNPLRQILHTVQVERNGFIQGMVSGTSLENLDYEYYGTRAYSEWIQINVEEIQPLQIPLRNPAAKSGSAFMNFVNNMTFANREKEILKEISTGNIPNFLRKLIQNSANFQDANGVSHEVKYYVMPNYLMIGSDSDYCRIPMGPITAQKLADQIGAVLPTPQLVDDIYKNSTVKLKPVTYAPVGNQNELVAKFIQHNSDIESLRIAAGGEPGELTGGTKKDVVLSNKIIDPARPDHVCIYGWHQLNGQPIQPLTNIHINSYVDYSHGVRFLNSQILLDGKIKNAADILKDPVLYKILSNENGVMIQPTYIGNAVAPEKPKSFGVKSEDKNSLHIIIKSDPSVQSYLIYGSNDGINFMNPVSFKTNDVTISNLISDSVYYIKIATVNSQGTSPESEVLACMPSEKKQNVIIVNGFDRSSAGNTYNFIRQHSGAFKSNNVSFVSATNEAVAEGLFNLSEYKIVDYILGDESTVDETFNANEQSLVEEYLKSGGNLFVSGSEIAWDLDYKGSTDDQNFIRNYLKAKYIDDAPGGIQSVSYQASGNINSIFDSLGTFSFDNGSNGTIDVKWPDVLKEVNGSKSCLLYNGYNANYGSAGVSYEGVFPGGNSTGRVVFFGFPFETIYPEKVRSEIMLKLLKFFNAEVSSYSEKNENVIREFNLSQNYPNPFNPSTTIRYSIPKTVNVKISVFDLLGREISILTDEEKSPGNYSIIIDSNSLNGKKLASGIYFYTIQAGNFKETKKMVLLK